MEEGAYPSISQKHIDELINETGKITCRQVLGNYFFFKPSEICPWRQDCPKSQFFFAVPWSQNRWRKKSKRALSSTAIRSRASSRSKINKTRPVCSAGQDPQVVFKISPLASSYIAATIKPVCSTGEDCLTGLKPVPRCKPSWILSDNVWQI